MDPIANAHPAARAWAALLGRLQSHVQASGAHPARTVVLLPYAQLMPVARQFWSRLAPTGFAPRFETTMNWARRCAWAPGELDLSFEMGRDLLAARHWLEQGGLARQADALAGRLVEAAWQAAEAARAVPPQERTAWAARLRPQLLQGLEGPALATEAAIARIAFEWAAASAYATDALLDGRLAGDLDCLVIVQGLQPDAIGASLCRQLGSRALVLPWPREAPQGALAVHAASDAADEAERAAACVLRHVEAGRVPVALVAVDRVLTRRVGALLATRGVPVHDETGWKLSTTRAAANLTSALRALAWDASCDAVLDFLKNAPAFPPGVVQRMERLVRKSGQREWRMLRPADWAGSDSAAAAAARVDQWRADLQAPRALVQWLADARALLQDCGQWEPLNADAAGLAAVQALRLDADLAADWSAWGQGQRRLAAGEFTGWASEVLEAVSFVPPHAGDEPVVVLPMPQLLGHPFAALVFPGCDERNLPAAPEPPPAWGAPQRRLLGLPGREALEAVQRGGWALALQNPCCDLLWRGSDDSGEPTLASPLLQALVLAGEAPAGSDPREARSLLPQPVLPPAPAAPQLVPSQLSASSYEDLRRCPYRFFALRMLGLREADELEAEVDKRDFGNWVHGVLKAFQEQLRERGPLDAAQRAQLLDELALAGVAGQRVGEGEFLPFEAAWPKVRAGYLEWLARHEATGAVFAQGEGEHTVALGPLTLQGRIDRIDQAPEGLWVMDYKTEALQATRERMKQPLEDTQLAFYAALLPDAELRAAYLNVGERGEVVAVEHTEVRQASHVLREAIVAEMRRIAQGAAMPALGEGRACEFCAARGLCRRDTWLPPEAPAAPRPQGGATSGPAKPVPRWRSNGGAQ